MARLRKIFVITVIAAMLSTTFTAGAFAADRDFPIVYSVQK